MKVHFDGDLLIYRAGFAAEKAIYYVGDVTYEKKRDIPDDTDPADVESERILEPVENALHNVKSLIQRTCEALESDNLTVYLSGPTNFREGIATIRPYKGNRDPDHKPKHGPAIKEYLHKKYDVVVSEDEEADDVVAYSHYRMWLEDETSTVLVSTDKDLDMIPGLHYNFIKEEAYHVTSEQGMKWFYTQLLTGDATDNIPGVPKIGKVRAERALKDLRTELELYRTVRALYVQGYEDDADAALLENARLLWMRRQPNQWWVPPVEE